MKSKLLDKVESKRLTKLIARSGLSEYVNLSIKGGIKITKSYIDAILNKDIVKIRWR